MKKTKLAELQPDEKNVNNHSQYGMGLLENSLRFNGYGRSGLLSADNKIIAGNGLTEAAGAIGTEEAFIVDSDGTKPVYVRRTDIKSGTPEFYNMALADNFVALKNIVLDAEAIEVIAEEIPETKFWTETILQDFGKPKENELTGRQKNKAPSIKITFSNLEDMAQAEVLIKEMLQKIFPNSYYSLSAGEL